MITEKTYRPIAIAFSALAATIALQAQEVRPPNVILLVADDLGYGDLQCYGAKNVETPNVDALARSGIQFTNCHAVAATSTPSRYSLLTGEYAWRRNDTGVAAGNARSIIRPEQYTMADMFHDAGYATGAIGKWHLGLGSVTGGQDWNGTLDITPRDLGFDYHYIQAATADRVPCVYLEQDTIANYDPSAPIQVSYTSNFAGEPTGKDNPELLKLQPSHGHNQSIVDGISRIGYMKGGGEALWKDENIADSIAAHSIRFIREHKDEPFFLYLCTNDVHVPRWPHERFRGKNAMGLRGDAIAQFDWTVGQVTAALEEAGLADNTLIILTSDNGPILDDGYADRAIELLNGHSPTGGHRGMKYSGYEGGTIVPCIVSWPARVAASTSTNNTLMSHIDFFASLGSLLEASLPEGAAPDSGDRMAQLLGESTEHRPWVSEQPSNGPLTVRTAKWKYIPASNNSQMITWGPEVETGNKPYDQLYDMESDPFETTNVATENPEALKMMKQIHEEASSVPFTAPDFSSADEEFWYTISTPLRDNLCITVTSGGLLKGVGPDESIFARSQWKFTGRSDGTCNIVNRGNGKYIDPTSGSNTQFLLLSDDEPDYGWRVDYANTAGCVVFYTDAKDSQLNQSGSGRGYRILNWGGGRHDDAGCQFQCTPVSGAPVAEIALPTTAADPMPSTADAPKWYTICANKRARHYLADGGDGIARSLTSSWFMPELAWRIESRPDRTFNFVNLAGNGYLNAEAADETGELTVSADEPAAGWEISEAPSANYWLITSGSVQAFISTEADGYKVASPADAINRTNSGGHFRFVDITEIVNDLSGLTAVAAPERDERGQLYDLLGRRVAKPRHGIYINSAGKRVIY